MARWCLTYSFSTAGVCTHVPECVASTCDEHAHTNSPTGFNVFGMASMSKRLHNLHQRNWQNMYMGIFPPREQFAVSWLASTWDEVLVLIVNLTEQRSTSEIHLMAHLWGIIQINWSGMTHCNCVQSHSMIKDPGLWKMEELSWAPAFITLCFLSADNTWLDHSGSCGCDSPSL